MTELHDDFPACSWQPLYRLGDSHCWAVSRRGSDDRAWLKRASGGGWHTPRWGLEVEILKLLQRREPGMAPEVLDFNLDDERPWIVTADVGPTLRSLGREGLVDARTAALVASDVGSALQVLWGRYGIVHRDLKPANICRGPDGRFRLIDFGIATLAGRAAPAGGADWSDWSDLVETRTGTVIGTPRYMAPEQVRGVSVGPRADWWGLGASLLEAMGYRVPGETIGIGPSTLIFRRADPDNLVCPEGVPADLWQAVFAGALAWNPRRRRAPTETAAALRRWAQRGTGAPSGEGTPATRATQDWIPVASSAYVNRAAFPTLVTSAPRGSATSPAATRARCS